MARYIAQVTLQPLDALPKDEMENVWHFRTTATPTDPADGPDILAKLGAFYTNVPAGGSSIAHYLSPMLQEAALVKIYDEDATVSPRPVFFNGTFTIGTPPSSSGIPEEVALCLSYYSGRNVAKLRGRVYLGPWGAAAATTGDTGNNPGGSRPSTTLVASIAAAGEALIAASSSGAQWCLRSGVGFGAPGTKTVTYNEVTNGWVDNEWDSQRRRRIEATSRTTFAGTGTPVVLL